MDLLGLLGLLGISITLHCSASLTAVLHGKRPDPVTRDTREWSLVTSIQETCHEPSEVARGRLGDDGELLKYF